MFTTQYSVGDTATVKIVKLMTFGAFAEILPGVDGLIHISQIADRRIAKPEDALAEGQEVEAKIIDVDAENKRISLSIRALLVSEDEAEAAEEE
jgi:4-hydroxy-3-methylbut-2-enyl diphosphate reductase